MPFDIEGLTQRLEKLVRGNNAAVLVCIRQNHAEFIASQPRDGIRLPQHRTHQKGHLLEQLISGLVTEGIVHLFETVDVHKQ
jgi:hypothetical protein